MSRIELEDNIMEDEVIKFLEGLPDPNLVGTTEYRAIHDMIGDCDSLDQAYDACSEMIEQLHSMCGKLEKAGAHGGPME